MGDLTKTDPMLRVRGDRAGGSSFDVEDDREQLRQGTVATGNRNVHSLKEIAARALRLLERSRLPIWAITRSRADFTIPATGNGLCE